MGVPPSEDEDGVELSELELSAIAESANQMMAAAAAAIGVLLGQEIQISPPDTRVLGSPAAAAEIYGTAPHATSTTFMIAGEACRLIQLVPSAFVVRMARAIDDLGSELSGADRGPGGSRAGIPAGSVALADALEQINMRVWVELGRTRMPLGQALALPLGAVVDLDSAAEAPVNLYVNGMRFAEGHLVVTDDGEWAVCVDKLGGRPRPPAGLEPPARPQLVTPADDVVEEVLEAPVAEEAPEAEEAPVAEEAPEEVVEEPSEEPEAHQSSPSLDPETPESADPDPQESSAPEAPEPPNPNSEGEVT
jgi:flagellar motor switch protein FliN/FliY